MKCRKRAGAGRRGSSHAVGVRLLLVVVMGAFCSSCADTFARDGRAFRAAEDEEVDVQFAVPALMPLGVPTLESFSGSISFKREKDGTYVPHGVQLDRPLIAADTFAAVQTKGLGEERFGLLFARHVEYFLEVSTRPGAERAASNAPEHHTMGMRCRIVQRAHLVIFEYDSAETSIRIIHESSPPAHRDESFGIWVELDAPSLAGQLKPDLREPVRLKLPIQYFTYDAPRQLQGDPK